MNTTTSDSEKPDFTLHPNVSVPAPQRGRQVEIDAGFSALSFKANDFSCAMDPLVMVDHYRMSESTFGAHPHAGISAVSVIFEDSEGKFHNRDSLGNDFDLMPGDLYWLKAGSGVVHDEAPRAGARIHGLQVFVNLPALMEHDAPASLRVKAQDIPVLKNDGNRVRILLGDSNGIASQLSPALPMTILDGKIASKSTFTHDLKAGENSWVYVIEGGIDLDVAGNKIKLQAGEAIAIEAISNSSVQTISIANLTTSRAHFALFAAAPVKEIFVQKGPFVMSNDAEIAQFEADYAEGKFGRLK